MTPGAFPKLRYDYEVKTRRDNFAHKWSILVLPAVNVVTYNVAFWTTPPGAVNVWLVGPVLAMFLMLFPFLPVYFLAYGRGMDFDVGKREKRGQLFLMAAAIYFAGAPIFKFLEFPRWEFLLTVFGYFSAIFGVISFFWKISNHVGNSVVGLSASALLLMDAPLLRVVFWSGLVAVGAVTAYTRLVLKRHTRGQLVAGAVVALGVALSVYLFFFQG
ncbi:MAG: phosphatase PAP2 family protein [Promethearchaeota archaeon]